MAVAILSFQAKRQKTFASIQFAVTTLFCTSFLLVGATTGAMLNFLGAVRALIYYNKQKLHADRPVWLIAFVLCYMTTGVLTFTVFGTPLTIVNVLLQMLPIIGMTASHLALYINSDKAVRRFSLISSPVWLIYNLSCQAWGAVGCEAISLVSIGIGIYRHDINRKPKKTAK